MIARTLIAAWLLVGCRTHRSMTPGHGLPSLTARILGVSGSLESIVYARVEFVVTNTTATAWTITRYRVVWQHDGKAFSPDDFAVPANGSRTRSVRIYNSGDLLAQPASARIEILEAQEEP